jgi:organic radical activating enzyme
VENSQAVVYKTPHVLFELNDIRGGVVPVGPYAGRPAIFVDVAGCNLQCSWCTSNLNIRLSLAASEVVSRVEVLARSAVHTKLVVISGGEPLRQFIAPLISSLNLVQFDVVIETAGTLWVEDLGPLFENTNNAIVCSPKTAILAKGIARYIKHLVYICTSGSNCVRDGLPVRGVQRALPQAQCRVVRPRDVRSDFPLNEVYVRPCIDGNLSANTTAAQAVCERFGYRLTVPVCR